MTGRYDTASRAELEKMIHGAILFLSRKFNWIAEIMTKNLDEELGPDRDRAVGLSKYLLRKVAWHHCVQGDFAYGKKRFEALVEQLLAVGALTEDEIQRFGQL